MQGIQNNTEDHYHVPKKSEGRQRTSEEPPAVEPNVKAAKGDVGPIATVEKAVTPVNDAPGKSKAKGKGKLSKRERQLQDIDSQFLGDKVSDTDPNIQALLIVHSALQMSRRLSLVLRT